MRTTPSRFNESRHLRPGPMRSPLVFLALGLIGGWLLATTSAQIRSMVSGGPAPRAVTPRPGLTDAELADIRIFRETHESVVYIRAIAVQRGYFSMEEVEGTGSGFVWDTDGHIVTNFHVIKDARTADIVLSDGTTWPARLVG
ncbi:MAG: trypsin-like peptidase domain-containing protein, partial [Phycisphaerales bacterium]|nr:trypsin-like peptidase domain-containing protein [Phycisphaerales bacterium]